MSQSRSNKSKSSKSPSPRKRSSGSKSPENRKLRSRSKSYQKQRRRRSSSYQRRRSPGRGPRRNPDLIPKSAKLFVTNIDSSYTTDQVKNDLEKQFIKFGEVSDISIRTKRGSANSFAFIEFKRVEDAEIALKSMNGKEFKGKELKVQFGKGERKQQDRRAQVQIQHSDKCYICHKQGHFAKDCRYREPSRNRRDQRGKDCQHLDYGRRRRHSRSSSSSRSPRRKRSNDRQRDREYRRRDQRSRDYRRSPDNIRSYRTERRQRY